MIMKLHRMSGLTLVELMVSMAIGLALTAAVSAVYLNTSVARNDLERVTQTTDNARFAMDMLTEDLRHAGFYGPFIPSNNAVYNRANPCTTAWDSLGWNLGVSPQQMPAAVEGLDDPTVLPSGWDCLPDALPGSDVVTLRRVVETTQLPASITTSNVPYVQASQCTTDAVPVVYSVNSSDFTLRDLVCDNPAITPVPVRQYITRTYYVATCNVCTPTSDGVTTLKRLEMRDGALTLQALAEGVVSLQMQYGFDTNNDGNVDQYQLTLNGTAGDPGNDWSNVMAVRVSMLMQSTGGRVSGPSVTRTYDLGPGHNAMTCADGRRCVLASSTVRLTNLASRREQP